MTEGVVESLKVVTEKASLRIAEFAFDLAAKEGRPTVSAIHKANIMKLSDGLFLECVRRVSRDYPDIELRELIIDNCAMQLVTKPEQFDVLVMDNLYGDIISDLCAGLVGGLGVAPGSNVGKECAVFEGRSRQRPGHRGQGPREPDGGDPLGGDARHASRRAGSGYAHRKGGRRGARRSRKPHGRPARQGHDAHDHRRHRREPRRLGSPRRRGERSRGRRDARPRSPLALPSPLVPPLRPLTLPRREAMRPVLVLALDGATFDLIEPMVARGELPISPPG